MGNYMKNSTRLLFLASATLSFSVQAMDGPSLPRALAVPAQTNPQITPPRFWSMLKNTTQVENWSDRQVKCGEVCASVGTGLSGICVSGSSALWWIAPVSLGGAVASATTVCCCCYSSFILCSLCTAKLHSENKRRERLRQ